VIKNWLLQFLAVTGASAIWLIAFAVMLALILYPYVSHYPSRRKQIMFANLNRHCFSMAKT